MSRPKPRPARGQAFDQHRTRNRGSALRGPGNVRMLYGGQNLSTLANESGKSSPSLVLTGESGAPTWPSKGFGPQQRRVALPKAQPSRLVKAARRWRQLGGLDYFKVTLPKHERMPFGAEDVVS